jgi:hypothetical protein
MSTTRQTQSGSFEIPDGGTLVSAPPGYPKAQANYSTARRTISTTIPGTYNVSVPNAPVPNAPDQSFTMVVKPRALSVAEKRKHGRALMEIDMGRSRYFAERMSQAKIREGK